MKKFIAIGAILMFMSGCVANNDLLYWGDYSTTLYDYKKEPSQKTRAKHVESLTDIIAKSNKRGSRIPPGVYAELGSLYLESGESEKGQAFLIKEVETYPESQKLVNTLQQRVTQ